MAAVYLLGDWGRDNVYKIGVTRGDIEKRIKKLQTGNSGEIYLVDYFLTEHPFIIEKNLHQRFYPNKILNEWFSLTHEEMMKFRENCQKIEDMLDTVKNNPYVKKYLK